MHGRYPTHSATRKALAGLTLILLFAADTLSAQNNPYEFFSGAAAANEETFTYPETDMELFYIPERMPVDVFTDMSEFGFSHVRYSRRGYGRDFDRTFFGDVDLTGKLVSKPDYSAYYNLKRVKFPVKVSVGADIYGSSIALGGETRTISPDLSQLKSLNAVSLFTSDRKGRLGGRLVSTGSINDKWHYTAQAYRRWGRDASVDGVFTEETSFTAGIQRDFRSKHKLSFMVIGGKSENGLRSSATKEAFELTGDNFYNPSWGWYDGKKRNNRVAERFQPLFVLHYDGVLTRKTSISTTLTHRTGENSYTSLAWFDAATPYPDYYRYMPSYAQNNYTAEIIADQWKSGNASVSQINWGALYEANMTNFDRAAYSLEERVEKTNDSQFGITFTSKPDNTITLNYGARFRRDHTRFFKRMKDLMGGMPAKDTDQYLYEDEIFGDMTANNIREPYRLVNQGDRFGYDYHMTATRSEAFALLSYTNNYRFRISVGLEMANNTLRRDGNYEKEIYPGNLSYGKSDKFSCETYTANLSAGYTISLKHRVFLSALTASLAPEYGNVFLSPNYVNKMADDPKAYKLNSAQLAYSFINGPIILNLSGYYTAVDKETAVYNYYDDIAGIYSDMVVSDISKRYHGIELGLKASVSPSFTIDFAAAAGKSKYSNDPDVVIYEDATMKPYVAGAKTYLDGYRTGNSPESVASLKVTYNSRGWLASASYSYADNRYVTPNPARRMARAYNLAASPERFSEFVSQEKLSGAGTADLFVMKTFWKPQTSFSIMFSVNNLLNDKDNIYSGYEQMRIMKRGTDINRTYVPFPSKYLYAYGRNYYISVICRF